MNKFLAVILWIAGLWASSKLGLAELFCIATGFTLIFLNLGKRDKGDSAYSVFNKGCKKLAGQFDADSVIKQEKGKQQNIVDMKFVVKNRRLANKPCPCGSGIKHKKCCLIAKDEDLSD